MREPRPRKKRRRDPFASPSHDFEFSYGLTDLWLFSTTLTADEPLDEDFALSSVELELQYELIEIKENKGLGLAFFWRLRLCHSGRRRGSTR